MCSTYVSLHRGVWIFWSCISVFSVANRYKFLTCGSSDAFLLFISCVSVQCTAFWNMWLLSDEREGKRQFIVQMKLDVVLGKALGPKRGDGAGVEMKWGAGRPHLENQIASKFPGEESCCFYGCGGIFSFSSRFVICLVQCFFLTQEPSSTLQCSLVAKGSSESICVMSKLRIYWQRLREPGRGSNLCSIITASP